MELKPNSAGFVITSVNNYLSCGHTLSGGTGTPTEIILVLNDFKIRKYFLIFLFYPLLSFSQKLELQQLRNFYCIKNCKQYRYEQEYIKQKQPSLPPRKGTYQGYKRIFSIPIEKRNEIYPFNRYDSIYVASPNYIIEKEEKRNYLDKKYHHSIRQISSAERNKLSDILFNYYELDDIYKTGLFTPENEYGCIQDRYPKIILLFMKNGKFEKYIAFPDEGFNRYNFTNEDYWKKFDWPMDKEDMILKMFKQDILPEEKCKK